LPGIRTTPTCIENPDGERIVFRVNRVVNLEVVDVNWISKTYLVRAEIELEGRKEFATFEVLQSGFYPGVLIFPKFNAYSTVIRPDNLVKFFDVVNREGRPLKYLIRYPAHPRAELGSSILLWDDGERQIPALLRISSHQRDPMSMHIAAASPGGAGVDIEPGRIGTPRPRIFPLFRSRVSGAQSSLGRAGKLPVRPDHLQVTVYTFSSTISAPGRQTGAGYPVLSFAIDRGIRRKSKLPDRWGSRRLWSAEGRSDAG
jgi:hypothetical protein